MRYERDGRFLPQVSKGGGQQGSADAIAGYVEFFFAGCFLDCIEGRQRAFVHIVFEGFVGVCLVRVHPRDHENGVALVEGPSDEGTLLAQIQDVILVDPGRDDQKWPLIDLLRRRRILDELHEVVLVDDLAGR